MKPKSNNIEFILRVSLLVAVAFTAVAIGVVFFNDRPIGDKMYDAVFLLVGAGALILGIFASLDSRVQRHATEKIQLEISEAIRELHRIDWENDRIMKEIEETETLDRETLARLEKAE